MTINSIPALALLFAIATGPTTISENQSSPRPSVVTEIEEARTTDWAICENFILNNASNVPPQTLALLQADFVNGSANWSIWLSAESSIPGGGIGFPDSPPILFDNAADVITAASLLLQFTP